MSRWGLQLWPHGTRPAQWAIQVDNHHGCTAGGLHHAGCSLVKPNPILSHILGMPCWQQRTMVAISCNLSVFSCARCGHVSDTFAQSRGTSRRRRPHQQHQVRHLSSTKHGRCGAA